jgi:hypothetical protein
MDDEKKTKRMRFIRNRIAKRTWEYAEALVDDADGDDGGDRKKRRIKGSKANALWHESMSKIYRAYLDMEGQLVNESDKRDI